MRNFRKCLTLAVSIVLLSLSAATANDVAAGHDLFTTAPGGAIENFGLPVTCPIPADFFGPGADPFDGIIQFRGDPIPDFLGQPTGGADTIVARLQDANLPAIPSSDTIFIELVALSLSSVEPITVTFNGGQDPELWDVRADLSQFLPSVGQMTINHVNPEGGTYDAEIFVCAVFTFTRVKGGGPLQLDFCNDCNPSGRQIVAQGQPWLHDAALPLQSPLSGPNFFPDGPVNHEGPHPESNPIENPPGDIPTVSQWGLAIMTLLLLTAGTIVFRRRVATAV